MGTWAGRNGAPPDERSSGRLKFVLLGPVEAWSGDVQLDLGPPKRRVLLTRLLIEEGRSVSTDRLCDDLWEGSPPAGALSSVHAHISRLRTVLEPARTPHARGGVLPSRGAGYTLNAPPDACDFKRFEETVDRARGLLTGGRLADARLEIERGLGLWRGAALADAANYAFAAQEISRLEEIRVAARELNAEILLQQGRPDGALLIAEDVISRSPLREATWALLMRALYLAGRPAEALRRYERIRTLLAEELGTTPGSELSHLHMAVLCQDRAALAPPRPYAAPPSPPVRLLGATMSPLVGRTEERACFDELLGDAGRGRTRWVVLSGEAGIGKTRLAEEFAARAAEAEFRVEWVRCDSSTASHDEDDAQTYRLARPLSAICPGLRVEDGPEAVARELRDRLSHQPTICLIEDLHRADLRLLRLLGSYATLIRDVPLVVVCTTQDTDDIGLRELLALLVRRANAALLPLGPLTVTDVQELMKDRAARTEHAPRDKEPNRCEAALLHRRGEGNPFFITKILELPGDERTGPGARLPASVIRVLRARLDRLDERVLTMLAAIAVTGGELDTELLLRIRTITREELLSLIDSAVISRMLNWEESADPGRPGRYLMPDLARELVLHDLTPARRQRLHAAAGRALAESPHGHPVRMARHLMAAGPLITREELVSAALRAGHRCAEDDQHAEAELWFGHASALADDPRVRAEARHAAGLAHREVDELQRWAGRPRLEDPAEPEPRVS